MLGSPYLWCLLIRGVDYCNSYKMLVCISRQVCICFAYLCISDAKQKTCILYQLLNCDLQLYPPYKNRHENKPFLFKSIYFKPLLNKVYFHADLCRAGLIIASRSYTDFALQQGWKLSLGKLAPPSPVFLLIFCISPLKSYRALRKYWSRGCDNEWSN